MEDLGLTEASSNNHNTKSVLITDNSFKDLQIEEVSGIDTPGVRDGQRDHCQSEL